VVKKNKASVVAAKKVYSKEQGEQASGKWDDAGKIVRLRKMGRMGGMMSWLYSSHLCGSGTRNKTL